MKIRISILIVAVCAIANGHAQVGVAIFNKNTIQLSTGISMKYVEAGNDGGKVVIMLHGFTDTSRSFFDTVTELNRLNPGLKIYALDQRGHGGTSMPAIECASNPEDCFSPAEFANDVIAFMDQKSISKAYIVGHSMGSIIAQELSLEYPARVQGMVLIGSFINGQASAAINDYLINGIIAGEWKTSLEKDPGFEWPKDAYLLKPTDLDPELVKWIKTDWVLDPIADPELLKAIYPETMDTKLGVWIGVPYGLRQLNNTERLKKLTVQTLVLWATQDNFFPKNDQDEIRNALDVAVKDRNLNYHYKTYGRKPLPASGIQENDLGHNLQWAAYVPVAADINSFILNGKPTTQSAYADPKSHKVQVVRK